MRKTVVALAFALVTALGIFVPAAAAASGDPKVVIIVGATHGATAGYRADADVAYAEAIKYTSNVVKVYSPDATWAKVKAAVAGASIVIYMGHGNGWPSPYAYDPAFKTKDGFGLNATAGAGDYNNVYYGEPSIATLDLAPGAIVLLDHLCYASGNSEPGNAEPTISVARQRADNYAAGFLKAGAAAVIAEGHAGIEATVRALFTHHQSIEDMWRTMPNQNGHVTSFPSVRTPGATIYQDPTTPTSGFWRSLAIGSVGVTTDEVISAGHGDTSVDPANLIVPGNASVSTEGANVYSGADSTVPATGTLRAGTRLRVVQQPVSSAAIGTASLVEVQGIDDTSISGYMAIGDLAPRDSTQPVIRGLDAGGPFSPNNDGQVDQTTIQGRFTEPVAWTLQVKNTSASVVFSTTGTGPTFQVPWNGLVSGQRVPDGTYTVSAAGVDPWGNASTPATRSVVVDTVAPSLTALTPGADTSQWFSPNGDGVRETVALTATSSEPGAFVGRVLNAENVVVRQWSTAGGTSATAVAWNGRDTAGAFVPDGAYTMRIAPQDAAGNVEPGLDRPVTVIGALRSVAASAPIFFPQDGDTLSRTDTLRFALARPMTVTWTLRDPAGAVVATRLTDAEQAAGIHYWPFDGRGSDGAFLPRGDYTSFVTATDGTLTATQTLAFTVDAFRISPSDTTPGRGQSIKVTVISAEALLRAPNLTVYQPGVAAWSVRMTKISTNTYRVTIRMKSSGRAGRVALKAWGVDIKNGTQASVRILALH